MKYFNRRNNYQVEYSGYEDVSKSLRDRLSAIMGEYINIGSVLSSYNSARSRSIGNNRFSYAIQKEFPQEGYSDILENGEFYKVFTIVEIFWDLLKSIEFSRQQKAFVEIAQAFMLSGSVYGVDPKDGRIILVLNIQVQLKSCIKRL
jgi:hypothetical protein